MSEQEQAQMGIGRRRWAVAEGYVPEGSQGRPAMTSHESVCQLHAGPADAHVKILPYFTDCEPVGPCRVTVSEQAAGEP